MNDTNTPPNPLATLLTGVVGIHPGHHDLADAIVELASLLAVGEHDTAADLMSNDSMAAIEAHIGTTAPVGCAAALVATLCLTIDMLTKDTATPALAMLSDAITQARQS